VDPGLPLTTERGKRLVVGLVRGLHGLRGAVRVEVLTDDPGRFARGSVLYPEGSDERLTVTWSREDGPGVQLRFRERGTRESVESLRDVYLEAGVGQRTLPEGAWYWHEIEGATVLTLNGEELGRVEDVFRAGESEVYVVRGGPRGEVLVPAVASVIRELAPDAGRIVVDGEALDLGPMRGSRPRGRKTTRALRAGVAPTPGADREPART
jgi:16S rRNA processing protein RimM